MLSFLRRRPQSLLSLKLSAYHSGQSEPALRPVAQGYVMITLFAALFVLCVVSLSLCFVFKPRASTSSED